MASTVIGIIAAVVSLVSAVGAWLAAHRARELTNTIDRRRWQIESLDHELYAFEAAFEQLFDLIADQSLDSKQTLGSLIVTANKLGASIRADASVRAAVTTFTGICKEQLEGERSDGDIDTGMTAVMQAVHGVLLAGQTERRELLGLT